MDISPLLKILIVFAGVLTLTRVRVHLGAALTLGGMALCLWAGRSWADTGHDLLFALGQADLWLLLIITAFIIEYGRFMAEDRNAQVIMNAARGWGGRHGRSATLMVVPAAIGLVPMPGGALFSAPLVAQAASEPAWTGAWKASVNYWFRHLWEYWWPLFPVVIVTLSIFQMDLWQFALMQIPVMLAAVLSGYALLIHPHRHDLQKEVVTGHAGPTARVRSIVVPLLIVVLATLFLPFGFARLTPDIGGTTAKLVSMLIGLLVGLVFILRDSGPGAMGQLLKTLRSRKTLSLLCMLAGVIVFKSMLDRSGLLPLAGDDLIASGIPLIWVVMLLPFIAGFTTGIAIAFAGVSFPLLAGLVQGVDTGLTPAATLVLGFAFGYAGMMLSPIHLCLVLSRSYFSAGLGAMYRYIIPCSIGPLAMALLLHKLLQHAGW